MPRYGRNTSKYSIKHQSINVSKPFSLRDHSVLETIHMVVKYKLAIQINIFQSQKLSVLLRP